MSTTITIDNNISVTLHAYMAWWFRPYVSLLVAFAALTHQEPDKAKLDRAVKSALRLRLKIEAVK